MIIAEPDGFVSVPIHSSVSGKVVKISKESNVGGAPASAIIIKSAEDNEIELMPCLDPEKITADEIRQRVKDAGIVGQGGAAFPTHIKLTPPKDKDIDRVILNGCECEPYLTRDDRFMLERPAEVVAGLKLVMKTLGVKKGAIGIEDNKPDAISAMQKAIINEPDLEIVTVKTKYPQGAEKMLIKAVLNREVPPGKLPLDVGVVIQNIGTAVSGLGINNPKNLIVRVGTPIADILEFCGGVKDSAKKVIVGGPMMGVAQFDFAAPVMKATSGILVLTEEEINSHEETPCLKCGMCVGVCPLSLTPTKLARLSQLDKIEEAEQLGISVCMECGTCAYTCPANIPLVQWIRLGKQRVNKLKLEKKTA